jgi:hypothetical protein
MCLLCISLLSGRNGFSDELNGCRLLRRFYRVLKKIYVAFAFGIECFRL